MQRDTFSNLVSSNTDATNRYHASKSKPGATAVQRIDNLLGGASANISMGSATLRYFESSLVGIASIAFRAINRVVDPRSLRYVDSYSSAKDHRFVSNIASHDLARDPRFLR